VRCRLTQQLLLLLLLLRRPPLPRLRLRSSSCWLLRLLPYAVFR
jgi:hypothetical protein